MQGASREAAAPVGAPLVMAGPAAEADDLVGGLREGEARLREIAGDAGDLWCMVAEGVPEVATWDDTGTGLCVLCERALALRGGLAGGPERLAMRERARVLLHLTAPRREPPRVPDDLLAWWDEATRLEPLVRLRISRPRWRTGEDPVPFTTTPWSCVHGPRPLPPGYETADPADIPALVGEMLAFLTGGTLAPELVAAHVPHLVGRIHPFVDGNGHTGRLLMCDLLSRAGFGAPTLLAYVGVHRRRSAEWGAHMAASALGGAGVADLVSFQLSMLAEAQEAVARACDGRAVASSRGRS